jgi:tetratricopeptide (TPR) repeat protein
MIAKAIMLWRAGDSVTSRVILNECITLNVRSSEAWLTLAKIEEADGRELVARAIYRRATGGLLGQKAALPQVWQSWARLEELAGETASAVTIYSQATLLFKKNTELLLNWAKLECDRMNVSKARKILQHAIQIDPTKASLYQASAEIEMEVGEFEKARLIFFRGVRACTGTEDLGPLLTSWAVCEWHLNKPDRARQLFEWAIRVWNNQSTIGCVWQAWATLEGQAGNLDLASNYISRAVLADSQNWQAWAVWASLEKKRGFHERAEEYMSAAKSFKKAINDCSCSKSFKSYFAGSFSKNDFFGIENNIDHPLKRVFRKKHVLPLVKRFHR